MTRTGYDALYTKGIPAGVEMALFYPYDNPDGVVPQAKQVLHIDNSAGGSHPDCHVADAETGAMEWTDVPGWVNACTQPFPTVYASLANTPTLFSHMTGVTRHWYLWVAQYLDPPQPAVPFVPDLPANCTLVGGQYQDAGPYDVSIFTDDRWYPLDPPSPPSLEDNQMELKTGSGQLDVVRPVSFMTYLFLATDTLGQPPGAKTAIRVALHTGGVSWNIQTVTLDADHTTVTIPLTGINADVYSFQRQDSYPNPVAVSWR